MSRIEPPDTEGIRADLRLMQRVEIYKTAQTLTEGRGASLEEVLDLASFLAGDLTLSPIPTLGEEE